MDAKVELKRRNLNTFRKYEPDFRAHFESTGSDGTFGEFAEAYRCGACLRDDEPRSSWLEVRDQAVERWGETSASQPWTDVEPFVKFAFNCSKERVRDGSQGVDGP